ncbi:fumarylacetoacetate hydrolase family protein [Robertmurraya sp. P23]|uniref:fumarylacetoacetate hydrolase family protein n=1 Tax=Robertmurraya sp. P23 TaxID=3436931 RepID=UPI003D989366
MKLATIKYMNQEEAAIIHGGEAILITELNRIEGANWETSIFDLLLMNQLEELKNWYQNKGAEGLNTYPKINTKDFTYTALYRKPKKILGVGMNYLEKVKELSFTPTETEPVSFLKPDSSLIGPMETIRLPAYSHTVTAEGELGIIIGKMCRNIEQDEVPGVVAGFTATLDMTAKDLHTRNPRFLQISKIFDTFFSFGPQLITKDEVTNLDDITVQTVLNGEIAHSNEVINMLFSPWSIVSFFSKIVTLTPGDIIMTGTPGSVVLKENNIVECRIDGFAPLQNPVEAEETTNIY